METIRSKEEKEQAVREDLQRKIHGAIQDGQCGTVIEIAKRVSVTGDVEEVLQAITSMSMKKCKKLITLFDEKRREIHDSYRR